MATIKEKGTIVQKGEVQSGVSQNGNGWARQTIVVDIAGYNGTYRKVALQCGTQQVMDIQSMPEGTKVEVSYQVTAREYNGRWYNNVDLFRIERLEESAPVQQIPQIQPQAYPQNPQPVQQPVRGRRQTQPQFPQGMPMDLQDDDLPPAFYQQ